MPYALDTVGLNFLVGIQASKLSSREAEILSELRPAGIILFSKNIDESAGSNWPDQLKQLISDCIQASGREDLLVSIDHEGGRVNRLPTPCTQFPYARQWADKSYEVGYAMARELRALSINLTFAPVLDVDSEPENEVIAERAFSTEAQRVWECAQRFIEGTRSHGVMYCGKHFPGHGATIEDSHFVLPVLRTNWEDIAQRDLLPFSEAIVSGLPLIMTAHVSYPELDPDFPATLSYPILTELLRKEMGFKGVVISDDLEMSALEYLTPPQRSLACLEAGVDLLMEGNPEQRVALEVAREMALGITAALDRGELNSALVEHSQSRVQKNLMDETQSLLALGELGDEYPLDLLGCDEHKALLAEIENQ